MAKVSESTLQMQLARDPVFLNRVQYLMLKEARVVKSEVMTTPYAGMRKAYATQVLSNPQMMAQQAAATLVGGSLLAGTADMDDAGIVSTATDLTISQQITADWNLLSGVDSSTPQQPALLTTGPTMYAGPAGPPAPPPPPS